MDGTIDVYWDFESDADYKHINILAYDRVGFVGDLSMTLSEFNINIDNMSAEKKPDNTFVVDLILNVKGRKQAKEILEKIKQIEGTIEAYRVKK